MAVTAALPLPDVVYTAALVFARIGALCMTAPGIGEANVNLRARLGFALLLAAALGPIVSPTLSPLPVSVVDMVLAIGRETLIGFAIGLVFRMAFVALDVAGQAVSMQSGLAMAQAYDPSIGRTNTLFTAFFMTLAVTLIFVTNLHHGALLAMRGTYAIAPIGGGLPPGDVAQWGLETMAEAFAIAIRIAGPLLAFGLVFYAGMGILARLMPQAQIFFISQPINILAGIGIVAITLGGALTVWADGLAALLASVANAWDG